MWYNSDMSRKIALLTLLLLLLVGCTSPTLRVATHLNHREFYYNRYIDECVTKAGPDYCAAFQVEVNTYKALIVEAEAADARGGKYPLQLKALKDQLKKVENARRVRSN